MTNKRKKMIAKLFFSDKIIFALIACVVFILIFSSISFAPTQMSDSDLSNVDGQAIFQITSYTNSAAASFPVFGARSYDTTSQNVIRLSLGIDLEMMAHMSAFKLGYWNGGWDQDTTNYWWGNPNHTTSPLIMSGVFIDLGFNNFGNNATRVLNYVEVGSMSASGRITGTLNTINGMALSAGTGQNNGVMVRQTASGTRTVHFNNEVLSFVFATRYSYADQAGNRTKGMSGIWIKIPNYDTDLTN